MENSLGKNAAEDFVDLVYVVMKNEEKKGRRKMIMERFVNIHHNEYVEEDEILPVELLDQPLLLSYFYQPQNIDIMEYCLQIIRYEPPSVSTRNRDFISVIRKIMSRQNVTRSLPALLELMDSYLKFSENWSSLLFTINLLVPRKLMFDYCIDELAKYRSSGDLKKFKEDAEVFMQLYQSRKEQTTSLHHKDYWGCRQQMLSGKAIADFVAGDYGPIDPIFGVLLNPTTGRVGPGDTTYMHKYLFDYDGPWAYHAAVHDAFGYLKSYHNIGPGYNYLGVYHTFSDTNSLAGQISGLTFWNSILD